MPAMTKIPVLLCLSLSVPIIAKSPNPPTMAQEQSKFNRVHDDAGVQVQRVSTKWIPRIFIVFVWSLYALEISAIAASAYPKVARHTVPVWMTQSAVDSIRAPPVFTVGAVLMSVGAMLRIAVRRSLGRYYTFELSIRDDHKLVTSGPYAFVRHPGYTANYLYIPGLVLTQMCSGSWWAESGMWHSQVGRAVGVAWLAFLGLTLAVMLHRIAQEDKALREHFGERWVSWSKRTPDRLLPFLY